MTKGPWYISASAVRDYLRLMRRPVVDDGPEWHRAEAELIRMAEDCVAREREGIRLPRPVRGHADLMQYRAGRPWRLALIVSTAQRSEGSLPQLVQVTAGHDGGTAARAKPGKRRE